MRAALLLLALAMPASAAEELRVVEPLPNAEVSGPSTIRLELASAPTTGVRDVRVTVDGRMACVRATPPFECPWDFGESTRRHVVRAVATLADGRRLVASVSTGAPRATTGFVVGVEAELVQVTATVTDARGRFVSGLGKDAFRIEEDRVPQPVQHLIGEGSPREIVIAVDASGSMRDAMPEVRAAVRSFLAALGPDDEVTILAFNDGVYSIAGREATPEARLAAVDRLEPWGGTALYDALLYGMDVLADRRGRKALVVFSDGDDQSSAASLDDVQRRTQTSDAPVYTIGQGRAVEEGELRGVLEKLSGLTGGRSFHAKSAAELQPAFAEIAEELLHQYLLAYEPARSLKDGGWRSITVLVPGTNHRVRARKGYRAVRHGR